MQKKIRFLFTLSCIAIIGIIAIQSLWVHKYYKINLQLFKREINLSFGQAVDKEFITRNDSLGKLLYRFVLDTNNIKIYSRWDTLTSRYIYKLKSQKDPIPDGASFSTSGLNQPIISQTDPLKDIIARKYAQDYRRRYLDKGITRFDQQNIGKYLHSKIKGYEFDTANLKEIYKDILAKQDIHDKFYLLLKKDYAHPKTVESLLSGEQKLFTNAFTVSDFSNQFVSIRAVFPSANNFLFRQLVIIVGGSLLLLIIVGFALFYMIQLLRKEKKASVIKSDFINNITHELKTPIATISTALEAFENFDAFKDDKKREKYLKSSRQQVDRLSDLVTKILNISLYERQELHIKKEIINLDNMVNDLIKNYQLLHNDRLSIKYETEFPGMTIKADKASIYSALSNIMDNAIKYSENQPVITIKTLKEDKYFCIEIMDNAIGISKEDLPKIFDKFYRVPATGHIIKGYGLGLFYVRSIIEKHKGLYSVQSKSGEGSIFKISLPNE